MYDDRKRQTHWPVLTYHRPCFDFSESVRVNADDLINIHEPSSSIILSAFYMVINSIIRASFVILSVFVGFFSPFFIETLNDKQLAPPPVLSSDNMTHMHSYMVILKFYHIVLNYHILL